MVPTAADGAAPLVGAAGPEYRCCAWCSCSGVGGRRCCGSSCCCWWKSETGSCRTVASSASAWLARCGVIVGAHQVWFTQVVSAAWVAIIKPRASAAPWTVYIHISHIRFLTELGRVRRQPLHLLLQPRPLLALLDQLAAVELGVLDCLGAGVVDLLGLTAVGLVSWSRSHNAKRAIACEAAAAAAARALMHPNRPAPSGDASAPPAAAETGPHPSAHCQGRCGPIGGESDGGKVGCRSVQSLPTKPRLSGLTQLRTTLTTHLGTLKGCTGAVRGAVGTRCEATERISKARSSWFGVLAGVCLAGLM
jgi:hypothetical protein